jgi:toxin-antitoxin system
LNIILLSDKIKLPDKGVYLLKEVAERLRSLRESVRLSQVKMAEIVGVKQSSLNRYELNQASPTFETLTRYADYFDVSMDYIFGRTDNPQGKLYEYKPKIQQNDSQMQKFVEMCFDPTSPMNARLKEALLRMFGEAKQ